MPTGARSLTSFRVSSSPPHAASTSRRAAARTSRIAILRGIVSTYDLLAELPLTIESHELERLDHQVSSEFTRVTTVVRLRGGGEEGLGEDVIYNPEDHERFRGPGVALPLGGDWTIDSFSRHLDGLELHPEPPEMEAFRDYRRWAFESAALDLALRQAGTSLAEAIARTPRPVRFVVSTRASVESLRRLLEVHPGTRFKLDPVPEW